MDYCCKQNLYQFFKYIESVDVSKELGKQIDLLHEKFECCDFDLYQYDQNNKIENKIRTIVDFYYDNIELVINYFSKDKAIRFICLLKKLIFDNWEEIERFLKEE